MPHLKNNRIPKYRKHRASGQGVVTLAGKDHYLGPHGSAIGRAEYDRITSEWLAGGRRTPTDPNAITVVEVAAAFRRHAQSYYCGADGVQSKAVVNFDEALKPVLKLYSRLPAVEFGPLRLKTVRESMIASGRVRKNVNRLIARIRGVFKWAAENELIPPSAYHGLMAVSGLRAGRCGAKESEAVKPVPLANVHAVLPFTSKQVKAMIDLQLLTGMRPGEVTILRGCDLETTGQLWTYTPRRHKTQLYGHKRTIYLGPKAQDVIRPFLKPDLQSHLFSPADAESERREKLHAARKTPISCGNRPGTNRQKRPQRKIGEFYTVGAYYRAVIRACDIAFPPPAELVDLAEIKQWRKDHRWHVHQLRHRAATDLRRQYGVEVSMVLLGHAKIETAQIYAEKNSEIAKRVALEVG